MRATSRTLSLLAGAALAVPLLASPAAGHAPDPALEQVLARDVAAAGESLAALRQAMPVLPAKQVAEGFELVGHSPLLDRGMNAALAVDDGYAYVGSRTDGQPHHPNAGILVVDVRDPASPQVVHEITAPDAGLPGETSRELRVWPQQDLLVVLNFGCSSAIHACVGGEAVGSRFTFFDISGDRAAAPELVATYVPSRLPHEFFLWVDPQRPADRALLFTSTPTSSTTQPNLVVTDISRARDGEFPETPWVARFPAGTFEGGEREDRRLHSVAVSPDGRRAYLSFLGAGFLVLDTSEVAQDLPGAQMTLVTPPENRARWSNPGAHSAVKIPGRDAVLTTDEVYGDALDALGPHGCPWGWVRTLDVSDEARPAVTAEYRLAENEPGYCDTLAGRDLLNTAATSYASHNPTLTRDLAFVTWHSGGLEAIDISDPAAPRRAATFKPAPLPRVATEDPALSLGRDKVVMWSYPVIDDGLVYVVDLRNGLYVLRYTGAGAQDVAGIDFLEGNSNLGDAVALDVPVQQAARGRVLAI